MILIEPFHSAVRDLVLLQFTSYKEYLKTNSENDFPKDVDSKVADFDGVLYRVTQAAKSPILTVSITLAFFNEIEKYNASKLLAREYGEFLKSSPSNKSSVTLEFNYTKLPEDIETLAIKAATLRRHCFAGVFEHFFDQQALGKSITGTIHFRTDETMFIQSMTDRVTIIFSTRFKDPGDMVLGKVFLQEFSEAKRRFDGAPQVIYCQRDPPRELVGTDAKSGDNIAYITIVLLSRHSSEKNRPKTIDLVHTLRTYMHYHIKCLKAYLHMRMRTKTSEFLKILNRANPLNETGYGALNAVVSVSTNGNGMSSGHQRMMAAA